VGVCSGNTTKSISSRGGGRGPCCWPVPTQNSSQNWLQLLPSPPLSGQRQALGVVGELLDPSLALLPGPCLRGHNQQQGRCVASSALCGRGSGAARGRALPVPCLCSPVSARKNATACPVYSRPPYRCLHLLSCLVSGAVRPGSAGPLIAAVAALVEIFAGVLQEEEGVEIQSRQEVRRESRKSRGGKAGTCGLLVPGAVSGLAGPLAAVDALAGLGTGVLQGVLSPP
jgi:hypothetical protein